MYQAKKDRKIQAQQKTINRLAEENEYLKEQLRMCDPGHLKEKLLLAEQSREEYVQLIGELHGLRKEYQELLRKMGKDRARLRQGYRQL